MRRGGARGKECSQRIPRRTGEAKPLNDDIEIKILHPLAILHRVHDAHIGFDAQDPEILDEDVMVRQRNRIVDEELYGEGFARRVTRLPSLTA